MPIPDHQITLQLLIAGILNSDQKKWLPPDSPIFIQAINQLSCLLALKRSTIPYSLAAWLSLFETPLAQWWPGELADLEIQKDDDLSLMYERRPEDWLMEYFEVRGIDPEKIQKGLISFASEVDQQGIVFVQNWCSETNHPEIYTAYREFLIRNPFTTLWKLSEFMIQFNVAIPVKIQSFYEEPSPDRFHEGNLWECPYCHGVLKWQHGDPYCIRHNVCGKNSDHYSKRKPIVADPSIRVLKFGSHLRTCTPGIPEVKLFDEVAGGTIPGVLCVLLWPGCDFYDLRVVFADGKAWAIDVKDLGSPSDLRKTIDKGLAKMYIAKGVSGLEWEKAFYVVPDFRLSWKPGYLEIGRSDALTRGETDLVAYSKILNLIKKRALKALQAGT